MSKPTFVCADCDADVYVAGHYRGQKRCGPCDWIASLPDEATREEARRHMREIADDPGRLRIAQGPRPQ